MPQEGDDSIPVPGHQGVDDMEPSASKTGSHGGESRSILSPAIIAITRLALNYPLATLAVAIGISVACVALTASQLNYKSSRLDLLNPNSDYNRLWIEYLEEFGDEDDAVIVVEGANRDAVVPVLSELSAAMNEEKRLFHAILHEVDLSKVRAKGLHYLSVDELRAIEVQLEQALQIVSGAWSRLQVGHLIAERMQMLAAAEQGTPGLNIGAALKQLELVANGLLASLSATPRYQSPLPWETPSSLATVSELGNEYFLARNGQLGFVLLRLAVGKDEFARGNEAIDALRQLIAQARLQHPEVKIGLTGLPIMENDEMRASQSSMLWASALSFVGVVAVVVAGFGGIRHAVMANLVLLIGMAWSFGYVTLAVGHLNILSVTFTVTLIGIGIDYGTYYISRYMQYRRAGMACEPSLLETTRTVGASIATGAITTAIAFFAAGFTRFVGVAELGIVAGGGILLCAVAQLFVLPALIHLVDHTRWGKASPAPLPIHSWVNPLLKLPKLMMIGGVAATVIAAIGMKDLWYDHNLLHMQPQGLESVELERQLLAEDQSMWYALSICDSQQELLERKEKFLKLASVDRVKEIASLFPTNIDVKQPIIQRINGRLANLAERPPAVAIDPIDELGAALAKAQQLAELQRDGATCARSLELLRDALRRLPASVCYERISQFQQQTAGELLSRLHVVRMVSNPQPPQLTDLPESLVDRFVGHNGKFLLQIYGRGNIWDMQALKKFVYDVRSIDPRATGNPLQAYWASLEMKESFEYAALYALLVIVAVLYLDFRNLAQCAMASLPLAMGLAATFGLLGYLDQPLNPANLIALPLLLGIGIDYGVHIVHEYLEQSGRYRMSQATAVAVMVDALTTIIGFGSLMIASHRGLQSLGRVLTLGVAACTVASMWVLPAVLAWLTRKRPLIPWVADAVESYDHESAPAEALEAVVVVPTRRAA
ncbi:MAG: MMPL family transporter [Pirellulales bacterium]|nr:MMPL family transporter [Pirellulales bacterium]